MIDCTCVFTPGHVQYCGCCGPRREPTYLRSHVELRRERPEPFVCQCKRPDGRPLLRKYRHQSEAECIPQADVDAFIAETRCGKQNARGLLWMHRNFASERSEAF